jgi:hypothetical protein
MSHHYSGPNFGFPHADARLDFCDLYAFPKPGDVGKSILIMNVHPSSSLSVDLSSNLNPPELTTSVPFAPDAIYELKIDTNGDSVADVTYRVVFSPPHVRRADGDPALDQEPASGIRGGRRRSDC